LTIFLHLNLGIGRPVSLRCVIKTAGFEQKRPEFEPRRVSKPFCDFLADPDGRSFSRFGAIIMQFAVDDNCTIVHFADAPPVFPRQASDNDVFPKTGFRQEHRKTSLGIVLAVCFLLSFSFCSI
jgi:hypothetical protein